MPEWHRGAILGFRTVRRMPRMASWCNFRLPNSWKHSPRRRRYRGYKRTCTYLSAICEGTISIFYFRLRSGSFFLARARRERETRQRDGTGRKSHKGDNSWLVTSKSSSAVTRIPNVLHAGNSALKPIRLPNFKEMYLHEQDCKIHWKDVRIYEGQLFGPPGVQLVFFFCSEVSKLFGAQGSPSSGSLLNL